MPKCRGYAVYETGRSFSPFEFQRREVGPKDVKIDIHFAGICHSDLHTVVGDWGKPNTPLAPGHEIVGIVSEVGSEVTNFKVGDKAGVGCLVNSCLSCKQCANNDEQFCPKKVLTYNSPNIEPDGNCSQGGYTNFIVVTEHFVLRFPDNLPMDAGAPLLCAGVTTYAPLVEHGLNKPGTRVGIVGLGGLGHVAVQLAAAMGCQVSVISTSDHKKHEAMEFGAKNFIVSKDPEQMKANAGTLDGIIDTAAVAKPMSNYLSLLAPRGKLIQIGGVVQPYTDIAPMSLMSKGASVTGSMIGGLKITQEMLDLCSEHNIACTIEKIGVEEINTAYERLEKNDVKYRFVIDIKNTLK